MTETPSVRKLSLSTCVEAAKRAPLIMALIALSIVGFAYQQAMQDQVFPTASIDLKLSRQEILAKAEQLSRKLGYARPDMISSISFDADNEAKVFLERSYGQAEANRLMQVLPVWFWQCYFKREFDKETAAVQLNPAGQLTNFTRNLENDHELPSLSNEAAKALAIAFVEKEANILLEKWVLIKSKDETQIHRVDHSFEWEERSVDYKGGHRRVTVDVLGNLVGVYDLSFHTPEAWEHSYRTMRSYNSMLAGIAYLGGVLIALGTAIFFVRAIIQRSFSVKTALIIGGIFAVCGAAVSFNAYPSWADNYNTSESYAAFLIKNIASAILGALVGGILIAILYAACQPMYRKICPDKLPIQNWFSWEALRSPQTIEGIILGFAACGIGRGYQIAYYFLGEKLGYWCPLGVNQYQVLGDAFPFIDALGIGVIASTMEEGLCRVMGLGIFMRLFRGNFWAANFLQAVIWGFMHSTYPQQPAYARGVELTIEGLFDGWLIARYGLIPCLVSHYLFDALWGIETLRAAPLSVAWTGVIPIAIPAFVLIGGVLLAAKKGLLDDSQLLKTVATAEQAHEKQVESAQKDIAELDTHPPFSYIKGLSARWRVVIGVLVLAAATVTVLIRPSAIGTDTPPLSSTCKQAIATARKYFAEQKIDLNGFVESTQLTGGITRIASTTYMNEKLGFAETKKLIETVEHPFLWRVRFCKTFSPYEYQAYVDEEGNFTSPYIVMPEDGEGAHLSESEARLIAENFLKKYRSVYVPFAYIDAEKNVRKNRTDYKFTFEVPKYTVADAKLKLNLRVFGDQVSEMGHEWEVPDRWQWAYDLTRPLETALSVVRTFGIMLGILLLVWYWIELIRGHFVRWRLPLAIGAVSLASNTIQAINDIPSFYWSYSADEPLANFYTRFATGLVGSNLLVAFGLVALGSVAMAVMRKYLGASYMRAAWLSAFAVQPKELRQSQRTLWVDGLLIALALYSILTIGNTLIDALRIHFDHEPPLASLRPLLNANVLWMPVSFFTSYVTLFVFWIAALIAIPAVLRRFLGPRKWLNGAAVVVALVLLPLQVKFLPDYLLALGPQILFVAAVWFVLWPHAKKNFVAVMLCVWMMVVPSIEIICEHGLPLFAGDALVLGLFLLSPLAYFAYIQLAPSPVQK